MIGEDKLVFFTLGTFSDKFFQIIFFREKILDGLVEKIFYEIDKDCGRTQDQGHIFVVDSQTNFFEDTLESLKELKSVTKGKLIQEISLIIVLNEQDLTDIIGEDDFMQVLRNEKLWYDIDNKLHVWNPIIYKTCALYDQQKDIYRNFSECARRTGIYKIYGNGNAPIDKDFSKLSINDEI